MTSPRRTTWGVLSLIEDPPLPKCVKSENVPRSISDKVPRSIVLHGQGTFIGRAKKAPHSQPQTQIPLQYISRSQCGVFLRRRANKRTVEAALKDTSSHGTFVNGSNVGKSNVLALKAGDEIELYQPQGENPLGLPIIYKLELLEKSFAQAVEEQLKEMTASAVPARSGGGGTGKADSPNGPSATNVGGTGRTNRDVFPGSRTGPGAGVAFALAGNEQEQLAKAELRARRRQERAVELEDVARKIKAVEKQMEKVSEQRKKASAMPARGRGGGTGRGDGPNGPSAANVGDFPRSRTATTATSVNGRVGEAARSVAIATPTKHRQAGPATTSSGDGKGTTAAFSAVAGLTSEVMGATPELGGTDEAFSPSGTEQGDLAVTGDQEAVEKAESQRKAAVAEAMQERARADAAERAAAEARTELQTMKADLQAQVNGLKGKNIRHESRMTDVVSNKLVLEKEVRELRAHVAETTGTCSGLEAQLKEARDADQDFRSRLSRQERAFGEMQQEKAGIEGKLAQRDCELAALRHEDRAGAGSKAHGGLGNGGGHEGPQPQVDKTAELEDGPCAGNVRKETEEMEFFGEGCLWALFETSLDASRDAGAEKEKEENVVNGGVEITGRKRAREGQGGASAPADSCPVMARKKPRPARLNTGTMASLTSRRRKGGRKKIGRGKRTFKHS